MTYKMTPTQLILVVSLFLVCFDNLQFFRNILQIYPFTLKNGFFIVSLGLLSIAILVLLFSFVCYKKTLKPILIIILLASSLSAYFMDTYNVIMDDVMVDNLLHTDVNEATDLLSLKQAFYFLILGCLPAFFIYKIKLKSLTLKQAILSRIKLIALSLVMGVALILSSSHFYASFFREHKILREYINPTYYIYSIVKYISHSFKNKAMPLQPIGLDAQLLKTDSKRKLIILVIGETARADHFSLNGYSRKTNPYLEKESVISFRNVWSCGTSTAYSVPCLFSKYDRDHYSKEKAAATENVLDILQRTGINVLWLDNNSDSKGVADRIPYQNYKTSEHNPLCDSECRDEGMLQNLPTYIAKHPQGDIFIVLHQMGNHGPAYYKRYPEKFAQFTPACNTNQLEQCTQQEIKNAYDNALLYSDYFLSQSIAFLKKSTSQFETALLYVSDHGESLGENNLYLHGLPYLFAPDTQKHIPFILWFSPHFNPSVVNMTDLKTKINDPFSHDNLFHTILGLMEIKTKEYNKKMDIFRTH